MRIRTLSASPAFLAALFAAVFVLLPARPAHASPTYPGLLQKDLGMPCPPPCTVCHQDRNGGLYTVDKPFGATMYMYGLRGQNPDSLHNALKAIENSTSTIDSDNDGIEDIAELKAGTDPNSSANGSLCAPTYGCGAHIAPRPHESGLGALLAALAGFVLLVGMRRRR